MFDIIAPKSAKRVSNRLSGIYKVATVRHKRISHSIDVGKPTSITVTNPNLLTKKVMNVSQGTSFNLFSSKIDEYRS